MPIDKPQGISSSNVVYQLRKIFKEKKVGHCGTLDPFATGVLVILFKECLPLQEQFLSSDKEYQALLKLGVETDTLDTEGAITQKKNVSNWTIEEIRNHLSKKYTGKIWQIPPKFSALKVKGKRAYNLARNKQDFKLSPRLVHIKKINFLSYDRYSQLLKFTVLCSAGTYIRSLAKDFAKDLGTVGHLIELQRNKSGLIDLSKCTNLEAIKKIKKPEKIWSVLRSPKNYLKFEREILIDDDKKLTCLLNGNFEKILSEQITSLQHSPLKKNNEIAIYLSNKSNKKKQLVACLKKRKDKWRMNYNPLSKCNKVEEFIKASLISH